MPLSRPAFLPDDVLFESFTYPAFDLNYSADPRALAAAFLGRADTLPRRGRRGVYIHIPFCDSICRFCPFKKSVGTPERIAAYADALLKEIEIGAATPFVASWEVDAIYLGGGTPSVLGPEQIYRLMSHLKRHLRLAADVEITLEVEPKSASEEVLRAGREAGATRVSFGVQTLDHKLRQMMNLTASIEQIERTIELSRKHYANTNMDMIAGYPGQSVADAQRDMEAAAALGAGSISLYPLDYVAVLPKVLNEIRAADLPPAATGQARWDLFHEARAVLTERYEAQNMYCFGEPGSPKCRYMFDILYGGYWDQAIGFGLGAYSMLRGLAYANAGSEADYIAQIEHGQLPIAAASPGHAYEKSLVYAPKRLYADLAEAQDLDIADTVMPKVEALAELGLVTLASNVMTLTPAGEREYAQMMIGFMGDAQRRLYDRACRRLMRDLNWGIDGPLSETRSQARALAASTALPMARTPAQAN